jgi:hypothetical protein
MDPKQRHQHESFRQCRCVLASLARLLKSLDSHVRPDELVAMALREIRSHRRGEALIVQLAQSFRKRADPDGRIAENRWFVAVSRLVESVLPLCSPAHAALIHRLELSGQMRAFARAELKMRPGTFDVTLHRARRQVLSKLREVAADPRQP